MGGLTKDYAANLVNHFNVRLDSYKLLMSIWKDKKM